MALTATFTANFASFYDAVDKADAKLRDFGDGADKVGSRLDKLGNQFSGRALIQEATLAAKAVEDIGGTSALTEKELAKLGRTTTEAVDKMKRLGMDVPANLQKIADETKGANKQTVDWLGTLGKMAAAVGLAFSVEGIVNFVGSIFTAADEIKNMATAWGISTTAAQQWTRAAAQSGVESETLGKSIQFVTESIGGQSAAYDALLANIGLSGAALRALPIEEAYRTIVERVAGIKDQTQQLDIALGLLGPSAKKMMGALQDEFLKVGDATKVMSDDQIKRLAAAQSAWTELKNQVVIVSGEMLAAILADASAAASGWGKLWGDVKATLSGGVVGHQAYIASLGQVGQAAAGAGLGLANMATGADLAAGAAGRYTPAIKTTAEVLADQKAKETAAAKATADRAAALATAKKIQEDYTKAVDAHNKTLTDQAEIFAGGDLVEKANFYMTVLQDSVPVQEMTRKQQDAINVVMRDAIGVFTAMGVRAPEAMLLWAAATDKVTKSYADLRQFVDKGLSFPTVPTVQLPAAPPASMFTGFATGLSKNLTTSVLAAVEGGGSVLKSAGTTIGNYILDPKQSKVGETIAKAASKLPGIIGGAVSVAIPFVGPLIGPAVSLLAGKIMSFFGKSEAEKMRDQFVTAAGGIDELRDSASKAGISLDALFKAKKTDDVKASIDEINAAFKFQADAIDLAIETATRYGFTLDELGPALGRQELDKQAQQIYKDWEVLNSAGLDSIVITDRMSDAVSTYVQHALKMGAEVPEAMRPMLEAFAKSGNLLDENGNAITDVNTAGIKFSMSMSDGFKALIDQVGKLTDAIARGLGLAIDNVPDIEIEANVKYNVGNLPAQNVSPGRGLLIDAPGYATGTDGFQNFGAGTPVVLHGWEAVVPRDGAGATVSAAALAAPASTTAAPTIIINAQGAMFDTPADLQRLAARVEDALNARHGLSNKRRAA